MTGRRITEYFIERSRISELICSVTAGALGFLVYPALDVTVQDHEALYVGLAATSIALMAVVGVVVNLVGALGVSQSRGRLARSARAFSVSAFLPLFALAGASALALALVLFDGSLRGDSRYALVAVWAGATLSATVRALLLGRRLLEVAVRERAPDA